MYVPIEIVFVFRHSATILSDQLVIFGGWDAPIPYNDLFILDMCKMKKLVDKKILSLITFIHTLAVS